MSDNTPDFDNMTPEEIMAWMETLAKRQGASEGFTTAADMEVAEIDPDTVVIDEPGYVPYGQEGKTQPMSAQPPAQPPAKPAAPPETAAPPQPTPPQPASMPEPPRVEQPRVETPRQTPPQTPAPVQRPPEQPSTPRAFPSAPSQPAAQQSNQPSQAQPSQNPPRAAQPLQPLTQPPAPPAPPPAPPQTPALSADEPPAEQPPVDESALAWLESLAEDESEQLFNLDLSDLPEETTTVNEPTQPVNPMTWLEDLARSQVAEPSLESLGADEDDQEESEKLDPFAEGVNSMEWIETLAKRQGADPEELTTRAGMNIPAPDEDEVEAEDYQPFSFDTPPAARRSPEPQGLENPADWLNSLAGSEGYSEEGVRATQPAPEEDDMSLDEIQDAINAGTVTGEQMQFFLDRQAEQLAQEPEIEMEEEPEVDEPLAPAELPDWLSELKPAAPAPEPTKPIDELFEAEAEVEEPVPAEMPDWLREDMLDEDSTNLESIFATDESMGDDGEPETADTGVVMPSMDEIGYELDIDTSDPWVEAFDLEYEQGAIDVDDIPEWYSQNVADPDRIAAVEGQIDADETEAQSSAQPLADAELPVEKDLSAGQAEAIPPWASEFSSEVTDESDAASENVFAEMPDWLREVEASVSPDDIPEWLVETISAPIDVEPEPTVDEEPTVVFQQPIEPPTPPPTPVQQPAPAAQVAPQPAQPAPQPQQPKPEPVRVEAGQASEVLARARDKEQSGDLEGALADYEGMIRASVDLDNVVADLTQLTKSYKSMPAVYRVLGDGLMRQGNLQAALNTYREALNQL